MSVNAEYYRVFPIDLASKLNNKEAMSYLLLLFKSDFITGESNVLLETLSNLSGYDAETISNHLHKVADNSDYLSIDRRYIGKESGKPKTKNYYKVTFPAMNFIMVDSDFLDFEIEGYSKKTQHDIKGFILLIKCLCLNNTNITKFSLREIEKRIGLSYCTIQNYMKKCIDLGYIIHEKGCYRINLSYFDKDNSYIYPAGTPDLYKDIYNSILNHCSSKGVEVPPYNSKYIGRIAVKYPYLESELLKQGNDSSLEKRIPKLPDKVDSLNYFVKVLTNGIVTSDPNKSTTKFEM